MAKQSRSKHITRKILDILDIKLDGAFGMDISDRSIEILEMRIGFRSSIYTYGRVTLPPGIVEGGVILKKQELALAVREALRTVSPRKISTNKVILSLPESKVFIHTLELPRALKNEARKDAIIKEALAVVPLELGDIYWDFLSNPSPKQEKQSITFIAAPKTIVEDYIGVCQAIGLEVAAIDLESISAARALCSERTENARCILDIGSEESMCSCFNANTALVLSVAIPLGGGHCTRAVMDAKKITESEAETLKETYGLKAGAPTVIAPILETVLEPLSREVHRALLYYEKTWGEHVETVLLTGGSSLLPELPAFLARSMKRDIVMGNPLINIRAHRVLGNSSAPVLFTNVIGLAKRGASNRFKGVNLMPPPGSPVFRTAPQVINLFEAGYLKKTAAIRAMLNNRILVITVFMISLSLFGYVMYTKLYQPFQVGSIPQTKDIAPQPPGTTLVPSPAPETETGTPSSLTSPVPTETPSLPIKEIVIEILNSPTGWVNVREGPGTAYPILAKVYPRERYTVASKDSNWYSIAIDNTRTGWIIADYAREINP